MASEQQQPWHAAFPAPTMTADVFPQRRALMVLSMKIASMLIVDVRRTDYEGGAIRGSINIPAHGFWWNRGILYELAYKSDMEWVVFTCGSCKEGSRGARCAAWFLDHVRNTAQDDDMQVMVLEGGMKGWIRAGAQYTQFVDGYDPEYWKGQLGEDVPEKARLGMKQPDTGDGVKANDKEREEQEPATIAGSPNAAAFKPPKEKVWSFESMMGDGSV
ncbi:Hypothetical predicted protein [Lecanosticta acicola]|uniref:Rhodanese domain-containing protein n=1 Tax=Lecanosticta acicola TaxID=111012 RepID=A0AAI9ECC9_9PEZI|nr:Hypothetical predicted protein [Lecanosticta acicola]